MTDNHETDEETTEGWIEILTDARDAGYTPAEVRELLRELEAQE